MNSKENPLPPACGSNPMHRFLAYMLLAPNERVVRVKSWWPTWGQYGLEWPCLLVDSLGVRRTCWPVWDWARLRSFFGFRDEVVAVAEHYEHYSMYELCKLDTTPRNSPTGNH